MAIGHQCIWDTAGQCTTLQDSTSLTVQCLVYQARICLLPPRA